MSRSKKFFRTCALSVLVFLAGAFFFPSFWAPYIWDETSHTGRNGDWDADQAKLWDTFPTWLKRRKAQKSIHWEAVRMTRALRFAEGDLFLKGLENGYSEGDSNTAIAVDVFPKEAFGKEARFSMAYPIAEHLGELKGNWSRYVAPRDVFKQEVPVNCRYSVLVQPTLKFNPKPDPSSTFRTLDAFEIRAVCPYAVKPGHWSLYSLGCEYVEYRPGDGDFSDSCQHEYPAIESALSGDPLFFLNLPPPWICGGAGSYATYCQSHFENLLAKGVFPSWPIYVEEKGEIRRATEADMKYLKDGKFQIPG